jgi:hypothetical protein
MFDDVFAPHNAPFAVALGVMLVIGFVEGVSALLGVGVSHWIDAHVPHPELHLEVPVDAPDGPQGHGHAPGVFSAVLGWFRVGKVPFLVLLIVACLFFGLSGLALQASAVALLGGPLPTWLASVAAVFITAPAVSLAARGIARVLPSDETEAVSRDTFVGRTAHLLAAGAAVGAPAQAKLRDVHGRAHYVLVEPDGEGPFGPGDEVLLTEQRGAVFLAIRNDNPLLSTKA